MKNNSLIKIEAEISNNNNNNNLTKSFVEKIASDTKNYNRVSKTYTKHDLIDGTMNNNNNKDSGIDESHKDDETNNSNKIYRLGVPLNDEFKSKKNNVKRINYQKPKLFDNKTFDENDDFELSSLDSAKLKYTLKKSKKLDLKIRKAIIDLLALDKLEKQKKLNILKQQKLLQLQKLKLNDTILVSQSLTKLHQRVGDNKNLIFPSIVKKYNPYGTLLDDVNVNDYRSDDFDQFYFKNKSFINYGNDVSYEEIMKIINDIETKEKLEGKHTQSNYYYNGKLIKGVENEQPIHYTDIVPQNIFDNKNNLELIDALGLNTDELSITSVSSLEVPIRPFRRIPSKRREYVKVEWDSKNDAYIPLKNKSEFCTIPDNLEPKLSLVDIVNKYFQNMQQNQQKSISVKEKPLIVENKSIKEKTEFQVTANDTIKSTTSTISKISKLFQDVFNDENKKNEQLDKKKVLSNQVDIKPAANKTQKSNELPKKSFLAAIIEKAPCKKKTKVVQKPPKQAKLKRAKQPKQKQKREKVKKQKREKVKKQKKEKVKKQKSDKEKNSYLLNLERLIRAKKDAIKTATRTKAEEKLKKKQENKAAIKIKKQKNTEEKKLNKKKKEPKSSIRSKDKKIKPKKEKLNKNDKKNIKQNDKGFFIRLIEKLSTGKEDKSGKNKNVKKNNNNTKNGVNNDGGVREIYENRRIFDNDLPGSNDNLKIQPNNNTNQIRPTSNDSSFDEVRNTIINEENEEDNFAENRYHFDGSHLLIPKPVSNSPRPNSTNNNNKNPLFKEKNDDDTIVSKLITSKPHLREKIEEPDILMY